MGGQGQLPLAAATGGLLPVAAYVRMSTEHQQYSTANQLDRIKEYAAQRDLLAEVDAGKLPLEEFLTHAHELLTERLTGGVLAKA